METDAEPEEGRQVLDLGGTGPSEYRTAVEDLRRQVAIAVSGPARILDTGPRPRSG